MLYSIFFPVFTPDTTCKVSQCLENKQQPLRASQFTLSELMISFLLMVPVFSDSTPPSSRMSRTSAPVAISPPACWPSPLACPSPPALAGWRNQGGQG